MELILRDGIDAGEFEPADPRGASQTIMRSLVSFCHPVLVAQSLQDGNDVEAEARASVRFRSKPSLPAGSPMSLSLDAKLCLRSDDNRISSVITLHA